MPTQDVEERLRRIANQKGVQGYVIVNHEGVVVKTSLDNSTSIGIASEIRKLTQMAANIVRDLEPTNDLKVLRLRSKKHEIIVSPERENLLIVIQQYSEEV